MRRVSWEALVDFAVRFLMAKGVGEKNARYLAEVALATEACGISTHGLRVLSFFDRAIGDVIDPRAEPLVVREKGATALIDGNRAFGQLAMKLATEIATRKAKEQGVAMVAVRGSSWIAGLAVYMIPIVEAGLFGQLWVQHSSGRDCAPFGGIEPRFSTNPVAFAFPTDGPPMIADFSTSAMAMAKVGRMLKHGEKPDEKVFLDRDGEPSDDPNAMRQGGSMLFTGGEKRGYKGFAMSLWSEALTAVAGGRCNDPDAPSSQAFNLTVIDPEAFAGTECYLKEMKRFMAYVKSSRLRPGVDWIRLPGERALEALAESRKNGILLDDRVIETLNKLAEKNDVPPPEASSTQSEGNDL